MQPSCAIIKSESEPQLDAISHRKARNGDLYSIHRGRSFAKVDGSHLDEVEAWRVWRHIAQLRAGGLNDGSDFVVLAGRQIIHHDDVAWLQSRDETSPHSTKTAVRAFRDRWFRSGDQPRT